MGYGREARCSCGAHARRVQADHGQPGPYIFDSDPRTCRSGRRSRASTARTATSTTSPRSQIVRYPVGGGPQDVVGNEDRRAHGDRRHRAPTDTAITINDDFGGAVDASPTNGDRLLHPVRRGPCAPTEVPDPRHPVRDIRKVSGGTVTTIAGIRSTRDAGQPTIAAQAWVEPMAHRGVHRRELAVPARGPERRSARSTRAGDHLPCRRNRRGRTTTGDGWRHR